MPEDAVNQDVHHPIVKQLAGYKKEIIIATVAVFVLLVLYAVISSSQKAAEQKAWEDIFVATYTAQVQKKPLAQELEKAIKENEGASAIFYAQMLQGSALGADLSKKEDLEKAAAAYESFVKKFPESKFIGQVRVDYGTVLANLGKYDDARTQYRFVIDNGPAYMEGEALLYSALTLEKEGKTKEAIAAYSKVVEANSQTILGTITEYATFARARLLKSDAAVAVESAATAKPATPAEPTAPAKVEEKK